LSVGLLRRAVVIWLVAFATGATSAHAEPRWFADRPVAWFEHDDADVRVVPAATDLQELDQTLVIRDGLEGEVDRTLSLEGRTPALDVNAADEVPCSTWFCARNHLHPMTPAEVAADPPGEPPVLPLTVVKGKDGGASTGFQVVDAKGRKFMLKVDPAGHMGIATGAELVGYRLFHAAGYDVPGAFHTDLRVEDDLKLDPHATFKLRSVQKRPYTRARFEEQLAHAAHLSDGRLRAISVPWMRGELIGGFDLKGRREDDPNDRIPHERRRSLRGNWVLFAWLAVLDPSAINTMDSYVTEGNRHFIRHYHFDFGCALGSSTSHAQSPHQQGEYPVEVGRSLRALMSLGFYHRPFEDQRGEWERLVAQYPSIGYLPEDFDPDSYRTNRKLPTHIRMTDRDAYWGAKIVTSFSNAQIDAVMATADLPAPDAAYATHALEVRRDILGRRYLRAVTAVEEPAVSGDGAQICFQDLAIARGYAAPWEATYQVAVSDGLGHGLFAGEQRSTGPRACVPLGGAGPGSGYRVVAISTRLAGGAGLRDIGVAKTSRIHLRWRTAEGRFVVVGLERDE
jgi:hypothetical protein